MSPKCSVQFTSKALLYACLADDKGNLNPIDPMGQKSSTFDVYSIIYNTVNSP